MCEELQTWVASARAGDKAARDKLILNYWDSEIVKKALNSAMKKLPMKMKYLREELRSDVSVEVVELIDQFLKTERPAEHLTGYIKKAIKRGTMRKIDLRMRENPNHETTVAVLDDTIDHNWRELLESCKNDEQRQIIELRSQGFTYDEISSKLQVSSRTIARRTKEFKDSLKHCYDCSA